MRLLLISCHNNKLFLFTELANIVVVIVTNPMFILPWVHEKFTVKFTMSNVDGCAIYMHIGCLNCPEFGGRENNIHNIIMILIAYLTWDRVSEGLTEALG